MSVRSTTLSPKRRRAPLSRRSRLLVALVGVVAVLAAAGLIGSQDPDASPLRTEVSARAHDRAGSTGTASTGTASTPGEVAPPTTIAPSGAPESGGSGSTADEAVVKASVAAGDVAVADTGSGADADGSGRGGGSATVGPKIVRTGALEVEVPRGSFDRAYARLTTLANGTGGFVSASQTSALDDAPQGTITLRVPVDRFDEVLTQVRKLGKVQSVTTGSDDVSGEYSDVSARIHALKAERDQINLVLAKAENIPDILSVRDRLSVVQGELEELQGRKQVLDDQTSLSTLTVTLREKGTVTSVTIHPPAERSGFARLWHDSGDRFAAGARSIALGLATMLPWMLLALVLFLPARALWRRATDDPGHPTMAAGSDV